MKIIKISKCSDCPYGEGYFRTEDIEKKRVSEHVTVITKQRCYMEYYCNENDDELCGEGDSIPKWCPLEDYKEGE